MRYMVVPILLSLTACAEVPAPQANMAFMQSAPTQQDVAALDARSVWSRISPIAANLCRETHGTACPFAFSISRSPAKAMNAQSWVSPDGTQNVALGAGLLAQMKSADELAFVLSHEAAHAVADHHAPGAPRNLVADLQKPQRSQKFKELEADAIGTLIASKAGYDPLAGVGLLSRLMPRRPQSSSSHPALQDRVNVIKNTRAAILAGHEITLN